MNPRYPPANPAALSPMAADSIHLHDLCSLSMDRAIAIEEASLTSVIQWNSCACEIYTNVFAFYMDLQMRWFTIMLPHGSEGSESLSQVAPLSSSSHAQVPATAEVLERSMDIVIGALETPGSAVASSPDRQAQYGNRARAQTA